MKRMVERRKFAEHMFKDDFGPWIQERTEEAKEEYGKYEVESKGEKGFKVIYGNDKHIES